MVIWSEEVKELETLYHSLKGKFPVLEKELIQLIETRDANVALLYSRRSLEVIVTDVCERELKRSRGTEPLKGIIDKLNREGKVPHNIVVSMQNLNSLSTFGTHPKDFKPRQVKPVLLDLTTILEWYLEYMEDQESDVGESEVQGKRKEPASLIRSRSKSRKRIIMVTSVLLTAAIIFVSLLVLGVVGRGRQAKVGSIRSLAILPFTNYTGDETYETLISGMHALLIADIGRLSGLQVTNLTSSNVYKNAGKKVHEIAKELKVEGVIEVTVLGIKDSIVIQVSLIKAFPEEETIWTSDYKEDKSQLLSLFNQMTKKIADEVKVEVTSKEEVMLAESRIIDPEAIDAIAYVQGYNAQGNFIHDTMIKAIDLLNNAIEKEPDWAPLYAYMGTTIYQLTLFGYESTDSTYPKVYENVNKALALDPDYAMTYGLVAELANSPEWNWKKAETAYKKLLESYPNEAGWRMRYSTLLYRLQRPEEAKEQVDLAYKLDPLNPFIIQWKYAGSLCWERDYTSAMSFLENRLATDPDNIVLNGTMEDAAFGCGDLSRMFEATKHYMTIFSFEKGAMIEIEKAYNERGFNAAYKEIIRQLEIQVNKGHSRNSSLAYYYYVINQDDKAIEYFEKAAKAHEEFVTVIGSGPVEYSRLYDNPRFIALLKKMNLPLPKTQ